MRGQQNITTAFRLITLPINVSYYNHSMLLHKPRTKQKYTNIHYTTYVDFRQTLYLNIIQSPLKAW